MKYKRKEDPRGQRWNCRVGARQGGSVRAVSLPLLVDLLTVLFYARHVANYYRRVALLTYQNIFFEIPISRKKQSI